MDRRLSIRRRRAGSSSEVICIRLQEGAPEQVADPEEHEDHDGHDQRHQPDHGQEAAAGRRRRSQHRGALARAGASRSAIRYSEPVAITTPSGPASSRARASARRGSATISAGGPVQLARSDCSVGGGRARGFVTAGEHERRRTAAASARPASRRRPCRRGSRRRRSTGRAAGGELGQRLGQRAHPVGVVGAVEERQRLGADLLQPAGHPHLGGGRGHRLGRQLAQERLGRGPREGEVAPLVGPGRADRRRPGRCRRARSAAPRSRGHPLGDRASTSGCEAGAEHERRPRLDDVELLGGDVGAASDPASGCAPGRRWSAPGPWRGSRWWRHSGRPGPASITATSTPRAGQLGVGGGGQRLELGHAVVARPASGRPARPPGPPGRPRRRSAAGSRSRSSIRIRSPKETRCGDR